MTAVPRELCHRCRRPALLCYCAHLPSLPTRARIVILQHPRESRVRIGTARMAHLALPNSELHTGIEFASHPRVSALRELPGTALLFPGEGARDPKDLGPDELKHLIVIDGTWAQARKVLKLNPELRALPRIGLTPTRPGNYRIRLEPSPECLATIEAVAGVLGVLERDPMKFDGMLAAFTFMVDRQLAYMQGDARSLAEGAQTRRGRRPRNKPPSNEARILAGLENVVFLHAEVNAHARILEIPGEAELLHLVAQRFGGERFEVVMAPRRSLAVNAPTHLGLSEARILAGETVESARERFLAFARPGDLQCTWGHFSHDQLEAEGWSTAPSIDLRLVIARRLQSRPGAPEEALSRLGAMPQPIVAADRASRVVEALGQLVGWLRSHPSRSGH